MGDGFEWVSSDSSEEEEAQKKSLPVAVKKPVTQLSIKSLAKLALKSITFAGIVILALIARLLLMVIRLKLPPIKVSPKVKQFGRQLYLLGRSVYYWAKSKISALYIRKPQWLRRPAALRRPNLPSIPYQKIRPFLSGLSFLFILIGLGAIFSLFDEGFSTSNLILIVLGGVGLVWLGWDGQARPVIARFLLKIVQMRNDRR